MHNRCLTPTLQRVLLKNSRLSSYHPNLWMDHLRKKKFAPLLCCMYLKISRTHSTSSIIPGLKGEFHFSYLEIFLNLAQRADVRSRFSNSYSFHR